MFGWAITFLLVAVFALAFGFSGIAASAAGIAKILAIVAVVMAGVTYLMGRRGMHAFRK